MIFLGQGGASAASADAVQPAEPSSLASAGPTSMLVLSGGEGYVDFRQGTHFPIILQTFRNFWLVLVLTISDESKNRYKVKKKVKGCCHEIHKTNCGRFLCWAQSRTSYRKRRATWLSGRWPFRSNNPPPAGPNPTEPPKIHTHTHTTFQWICRRSSESLILNDRLFLLFLKSQFFIYCKIPKDISFPIRYFKWISVCV